MKLTISVIVVVVVSILVCGVIGLGTYANNAIVINSKELSPPVTDFSNSSASELVMPPDLSQFVEEQYAYDLAIEVNAAAKEYGVPVELCWEVMRAESGFHHTKPNGEIQRSRCNALGICQVIPDGMAIKKRHNIRDRADNIRCMADLLSFALFERGYSLENALGWYNTGKSLSNGYARNVSKAYRSWVIARGGTPL